MTTPDVPGMLTDIGSAWTAAQEAIATLTASNKSLTTENATLTAELAALQPKPPAKAAFRRGLAGVPTEAGWEATGAKYKVDTYRCYEGENVIPASFSQSACQVAAASSFAPLHYDLSVKPNHDGSQYAALTAFAKTCDPGKVSMIVEHEPENVAKNITPTLYGQLWVAGAHAIRAGGKIRVGSVLMCYEPTRAEPYLAAAVAACKAAGEPLPDFVGFDGYSSSPKWATAQSQFDPSFAFARKLIPGVVLKACEVGQDSGGPDRTAWLKAAIAYFAAQADLESACYFDEAGPTLKGLALTDAEMSVWATS